MWLRLLVLAALTVMVSCDDESSQGAADFGGQLDGAAEPDQAVVPDMRVVDLAVPTPDGGQALCGDDTDCPEDQRCAPTGACEYGCRPGGCAAGQICAAGVCVNPPCQGDESCPAGTYCGAGTCEIGCRRDPDDCPPGQLCDARNRCTPNCDRPEICGNLEDEDCDGQIDDPDVCEQPPEPTCIAGAECVTDGLGPCEAGRAICPDGPFGAAACEALQAPAAERCDGLDNDCDGTADEDFVLGADCLAGVGACQAAGRIGCSPDGVGTTCLVEGGVPFAETCDGEDDDCDGLVDEDFLGLGEPCTAGEGLCAALGVLRCDEDGEAVICDAEPAQGTLEICNGLDDNCDGQIDEGWPGVGAECEVGVGACRTRGVQICTADGEDLRCAAVPGQPSAETCDRIDNDCDGETDEGPAGGELARACYTGPDDTVGVGTCRGGDQICVAGVWSRCEGQTIPFPEVCDGQDRDCDGQIDEDRDGQPYQEPCYDGPLGTAGQGQCQAGVRHCVNGVLSACAGEVHPQREICDQVDNDCNGLSDDVGEAGCACEAGAERACYSGAPATQGVGACQAGTQTCSDDGAAFGACAGEIVPSPEQCNGIDDDCDGRTDETIAAVGRACTVGRGGCATQGRMVCDGADGLRCDAELVEPTEELCNGLDDDCDGLIDNGFDRGGRCSVGQGACTREGIIVCAPDGSGGCSEGPGDPIDEICDGVDNDCDGQIDDGLGLGVRCTDGVDACRVEGVTVCAPDGQVTCGARAQLATPEICDGIDNDCDGQIDDGLGLGAACNVGDGACLREGVRACGPNGSVICFGGAEDGVEICNGLDDDCDGQTDEGEPGAGEACDTGVPGLCAVGASACFRGDLRCLVTTAPAGEICDGLDNDCDGTADEDFGGGQPCEVGVGACERLGTQICNAEGALLCDAEAALPGEEICNGIDDNCDGQTDERAPRAGGLCAIGLGVCGAQGTVICREGALACDAEIIEPGVERCNGLDDNCDGVRDEGFPVGQVCVVGEGVCSAQGVFRCQAGDAACDAEPGEAGDEICNDLDDDCDGQTDEGGVCPDLEGPVISLDIAPPLTEPGALVTLTVTADDALGEVAGVVLFIDGVETALNELNQASFTPQAPGRVPVRVLATDDSDNQSEALDAIRVRAPGDFDRPDVRILTPEDTATLSEPTVLHGRLLDANFDRFVLEISPDGQTWETLSEGVSEGADVELGTLDPTLLAPGFIFVKLTGYDLNNNNLFHQVSYAVPEGISVGESKITVRDFTVPLKGIPIILDRGYDSRRRLELGDFGYGWRLSREDVTVVEDLQSNVMVALPDGRREVFAVQYDINPILPVGTMAYVAPPGVTSTLEIADDCLVTNTANGVVCMFSGRSPAQTIHNYVLTTREGLVYEMHDTEGLKRVTDRQGNALRFEDDRITSSLGLTFAFERDDAGRITQITDPNGAQMRYRYDGNGDLVEATDPVGGVQRFVYDDAHRLQQIIGPDGHPVMRTEYDADGRKLSETDALGFAVTYEHDHVNRREVVTDRRGATIVYQYDAAGRVLSRVDELGNPRTYAYDADTGRLLEETDAAGQRTQYAYDEASGLQSQVALPDGQVIRYAYDNYGQITLMTNDRGDTNELLYDALGRLSGARNASGQSIHFEYDADGNRAASVTADGDRTTYAYDPMGNITALAGPNGFERAYAYDAMGNITAATNAAGERYELVYDAAARIVGLIDASGAEYAFERDGLGRMTAVTGATGHTTRYRYDPRGLIAATTDANGHATSYRHDPEGDLVATTDALGGVTAYTRDAAGRITVRTDPLGHSAQLAYDALGRLTARTDRDGRQSAFEYDATGRMVAQRTGDDALLYTFDRGRLTAATAVDGSETRYTWDADNRLTGVAHPGDIAITQTLSPTGRRTAVQDPWGEIQLAYTGRGRLTELTDFEGRTIELQRGVDDRLLRLVLPGGVETTYSYDPVGRPTGWATYRLGVQLDGETITLDAVGHTTHIERFEGPTTALTYDAAGQLIRSVRTDADGALVSDLTYAYDARGGRISRLERGQAAEAYRLDADQRLLEDGTWAYTYDASGNVTERRAHDGSGYETFSYGPERRLMGWARYDADDALQRTVRWHRDAFGHITAREVDGAITARYVDDFGERALELAADGTPTARHLHGDQFDQVLSTQRPDGAWFYVLDTRGNVAAAYTAAGELRTRAHYSDFGALLRQDGEAALPFDYAGRPRDPDTGLIDLRHRVLDPSTGRFLQQDPVAGRSKHPLTQHPYVYALNDPYQYRDPSGRTAAISYAMKLGEIFGLGASAETPNYYEMMGSMIGFFHGFASTGLVFLANILELANSGEDVLDNWGVAIARTQAKMDEIAGALGQYAGLDDSGFAGAFVGGANFKVGIKFEVSIVPDPVDQALGLAGMESPNQSEEWSIEKSVGGFSNGVSNFIDYLQKLAPN
jgi:RHS repeat-associated protein